MQQTNRIKEVWAENLEEEMSYLRAAIDKYPFVAMVSLLFSPLLSLALDHVTDTE